MKSNVFVVCLVMGLSVVVQSGCASKKYVRNRIAERVAPLENRTGELEETGRRNTQQIGELGRGVDDVRGRADRAQATADRATSAADQANSHISGVERDVEDLRANLDKYTLRNTAMVFFKPRSAVLTSEAQAQLDTLAAQIKAPSGFILEIIGRGDSEKGTALDENLAKLRADAVERYLADKHNIPVMRMSSIAFGGLRPLGDGASESASTYSFSRRVDIRVLTSNATAKPPNALSGRTSSSNR
ncbi:MAG TPA: OmpA family protein [Blastocatellia bacterium]|jgi:outer membrane protein OmpA-like peptidoglycan-associated protein|nr:OmpA family protein [Blastocatellia bacterium]